MPSLKTNHAALFLWASLTGSNGDSKPWSGHSPLSGQLNSRKVQRCKLCIHYKSNCTLKTERISRNSRQKASFLSNFLARSIWNLLNWITEICQFPIFPCHRLHQTVFISLDYTGCTLGMYDPLGWRMSWVRPSRKLASSLPSVSWGRNVCSLWNQMTGW